MAKIKIKCKGSPDRNKKNKLLGILCSNEIHITRMKTMNEDDGFITLTLNEDYAGKVFHRANIRLEKGFTPVMPVELRVIKKCHPNKSR